MRRIMGAWIIWMWLAYPAWAAVEIEGVYWLMQPEGEASLGIAGLEGTKADLGNDFGYKDTENVPGARLIIGKIHQFGLSVFKLDASAHNTIHRTIHFGDLTFRINENVSSAIGLTVLKGFYRFKIGPEIFHGGPVIGGEYFNIEAKAASARLGTASADADTGMLFIGAFVESDPFSFLRLRASVVGGTLEIGDLAADTLELEMSVLAKIPPGFHAGAGYRYMNIDARERNLPIEVDLTFEGPMVFVGFEW